MLPQKVILSVFAVLISQGSVVHALSVGESQYANSGRIAGRDIPSDIVARAPLSDTDDVANSDSFDLDRRGSEVTTAVTAAAIPALCVLSHKLLQGFVVYANCKEPVANFKKAFEDLKKSGKQAVTFSKNQDAAARGQAILNLAPADQVVPLRKALQEFGNQIMIMSFIVADGPASAVYRAGGTHADVGGTPLHPKPEDPKPEEAKPPAGPGVPPVPKKSKSWKA